MTGRDPSWSTHARAGTAVKDIFGPTHARPGASRRLRGPENPPPTHPGSAGVDHATPPVPRIPALTRSAQ